MCGLNIRTYKHAYIIVFPVLYQLHALRLLLCSATRRLLTYYHLIYIDVPYVLEAGESKGIVSKLTSEAPLSVLIENQHGIGAQNKCKVRANVTSHIAPSNA